MRGNDIVDSVTRLCAMNLYLHGIGSADGKCPVISQDALAKEVGDDDRVDIVLANPPFGKKSSIAVISEKTGKAETEKLTYEREDFWATTSNKQLNFVQHKGKFLETPISIPACIKKVNLIVEKINSIIESIDRLEKEINFQLKKAEKNKQSILASAFSGTLL